MLAALHILRTMLGQEQRAMIYTIASQNSKTAECASIQSRLFITVDYQLARKVVLDLPFAHTVVYPKPPTKSQPQRQHSH